jgi:hypothetical protein
MSILEEFRKFYFNWIEMSNAYVVISPGGAEKFLAHCLRTNQVATVVSSAVEPVPIFDGMIYAVAPAHLYGEHSVSDAVTPVIAKLLHLGGFGVVKHGCDITLGEIKTSALAQIESRRLREGIAREDDVVAPTGRSDATPDISGYDPNAPLPRTAVVICVDGVISSRPYKDKEEAENSERWANLQMSPHVVHNGGVVHLHNVYGEPTDVPGT